MTLTRDRRSELIAGCPLFTGLEGAHLEAVADRAIEVEFPAGRVIARQGEVGTGFFIVADGRVRVVRDGQTLATLGPGEFFGELSVLDGQPRVAQVLAEETTRCLALASWDFEQVLLDHPAVAVGILRGLAGRLRNVTEAARQ
ncbi:MAG TPA: cyclic nucleotide-binding domain-containing protein [Vitreimonas sp.]|nr:cyclic nucleotide-binding domain-containing protein [Vitreimonas sp.]